MVPNNRSSIDKFCPNLRSLNIKIKNDEAETLKAILNNCQQLESIEILCDVELLKVITKRCSENFHELKINSSWNNRINQKQLSLIIIERFNSKI